MSSNKIRRQKQSEEIYRLQNQISAKEAEIDAERFSILKEGFDEIDSFLEDLDSFENGEEVTHADWEEEIRTIACARNDRMAMTSVDGGYQPLTQVRQSSLKISNPRDLKRVNPSNSQDEHQLHQIKDLAVANVNLQQLLIDKAEWFGKLRKLSLINCNLTSFYPVQECLSTRKKNSIEELNLSHNPLGLSGFGEVIYSPACLYLKSFIAEQIDINPKEILQERSGEIPYLKRLNLDKNPSLTMTQMNQIIETGITRSLQSLTLPKFASKSNLDTREKMFALLGSNTKLTELYIPMWDCETLEKTFEMIITSLKKLKRLEIKTTSDFAHTHHSEEKKIPKISCHLEVFKFENAKLTRHLKRLMFESGLLSKVKYLSFDQSKNSTKEPKDRIHHYTFNKCIDMFKTLRVFRLGHLKFQVPKEFVEDFEVGNEDDVWVHSPLILDQCLTDVSPDLTRHQSDLFAEATFLNYNKLLVDKKTAGFEMLEK